MQKTALCERFETTVLSLAQPLVDKQGWTNNRFTAQMLRVMRMMSFFLFIVCMHVSARTSSQTITVTGKELTLKKVFSIIEKQTGYVLLSNRSLFSNSGKVSVSAHNMPLADFLNIVLKNRPVSWFLEDRTIVLSEKLPEEPTVSRISDLLPEPFISISGNIVGPDGMPLSGVTIAIKGTIKGTSTSADGRFSLNVNEGDLLEISSIGYKSVLVLYTGKNFKITAAPSRDKTTKENEPGKLIYSTENVLTVQLVRSDSPLDEVQITAYGKTSKRLATGNISTVKAEDIEKQPVLTAMEALIGRVPGITITQTSGNAASPIKVQIRGRNTINANAIAEPLYVIDGIPMTTLNVSTLTQGFSYSTGAIQGGLTNTMGENPLLSINPRDIESIDVLKDADATAIYGSRGANGVILITTKKSKVGPTTFNLRVNQGIKILEKYPSLLSTPEYLAIRREAFINDGFTPDEFNAPDLTRWDPTRHTDWQRMFIGTGSVTNLDASVSGGVGLTSYGISATHTSQKEMMNNSGRNQRSGLRTSFNHTSIDQKFGFSFNNNLAFTNVYAFGLGMLGEIPPNAPAIYDSKGDFNFAPWRGQYETRFPFTALKQPSESKTSSLQSSINLRYEIMKGLTLSANAGYQFAHNQNASYTPEAGQDPAFFTMSRAFFGKTANNSWTIEPQLHYNKYIGKGNLSVQLISNLQTVSTTGETVLSLMFPNDAMMKSYTNAMINNFMEGYKEYKYVSVSGIVKYAWDNKYIINLNARRDGSSRFGPGKQFGNFGSLGLAWNASDEKWLKQLLPSWFSFVKFRGSYGFTGSDNIGEYEYLSHWSKSLDGNDGGRTLLKYNGMDAFHVIKPLNQEFQWESTTKSEVAAMLGFWDNRINVELSLYRDVSGNQLTQIPTPIYTGFASAVSNWQAKIENTGLEFSMFAKVLETKDWGLQLNFNLARNRNKLLDFPNLENSPYVGMLRKGYSINSLFVYKYTGIDPMTGSYTFEDHNKDGKISSIGQNFPISGLDDRYVSVNPDPKFTGGFGLNASYKSLYLSTQFSFTNTLRSDPYLTSAPGAMANMAIPDDIKNNHWKQSGDLAKYPRYTTRSSELGPIGLSDANYVNGSYMRMASLSLSWQLPQSWLSKVKVKDARFAIETSNVFTVSPYRGLDPTIVSTLYATPIPRTITSTLSFTF